MLVKARRYVAIADRGHGKLEGISQQLKHAALRPVTGHMQLRAACVDVRISKYRIQIVDRSARHANTFQALEPFGTSCGAKSIANQQA